MSKQGKKSRKVGRNSDYCKFYKVTHRREKNKLTRLEKHVIRFPDDKVAFKAIEVLKHYS